MRAKRSARRGRSWVVLLSALTTACGGGEVEVSRAPAGGSGGAAGGAAADVVTSGDLEARIDRAQGTFQVARGGRVVVRGATADALLDRDGGQENVALSDCGGVSFDGQVMRCERDGLALDLALSPLPDERALALTLTLTNRGPAPRLVRRLAPLIADASRGGGLVLGPRVARHRILENGRYGVFDQTAQIEAGDVRPWALGKALSLPFRGGSVSNWSHAIVDLDDPTRSLVAGYLTFERSIPTLGVLFDEEQPPSDATFTTYAADSVMIFSGRRLAPGESLASETLYLDPLPDDPRAALERYATALARHQHVTPWTRRAAGNTVPNGWNSWTGGASTGGYGQAIDETLILQSMEVLRSELKPFGNSLFPIDDGWQRVTGDWRFRPDTFPSGGAALASAIAQAGLTPGLWVAPFWVAPEAPLASEHPDWLMPLEDSAAASVGKDRQMLDLTHPAVREHVRADAARLREEGWRWIKTDFTYLDALGDPQHDPGLTNIEALRAGFGAVRAGLGPDVFVLGIGLLGLNVGYADGMRLTLDNGPRWDEVSAAPTIASSRAFKGTVRTGSRRWFFQNRVWLNHDDLIFFRSWPEPSIPPLSLEETRAFATWIGLMGSSVEVGDKLLELTPPQIDLLRRLLPVYPEGARPLDVMERDYPERFEQQVDAPAGRWRNVGLCNWGTNRDLTTEPPTPLPEQTRSYPVGCDGGCVAHEFWSGEFLGVHDGDFSVEVPPRRCRVVAVRSRPGRPQLIGSNRHLTQGATDVLDLSWDEATRTLSGHLLGAAGTPLVPFAYELSFHAPAGFALTSAQVDGVTPQVDAQGEVVRVGFSLTAAQDGQPVGFSLRFGP